MAMVSSSSRRRARLITADTRVWADMPVTDVDRARAFCSTVLEADVKPIPGMEAVALLPGGPVGGEASGALVKRENVGPGVGGATISLDGTGDPDGMLQRAAAAGGTVAMPVSDTGETVGVRVLHRRRAPGIGVHGPRKQG
jgi:predicted enzyme related to lactoylglutathione lyase